jgi:hypothetical protein
VLVGCAALIQRDNLLFRRAMTASRQATIELLTSILDRITSQRLGESDSRSSVAPVADAEDAVIDESTELHDDLLGYPPTWQPCVARAGFLLLNGSGRESTAVSAQCPPRG